MQLTIIVIGEKLHVLSMPLIMTVLSPEIVDTSLEKWECDLIRRMLVHLSYLFRWIKHLRGLMIFSPPTYFKFIFSLFRKSFMKY